MWDRVTVETAAQDYPISIDDLRIHARVDAEEDEATLTRYLNSAIAHIDGPGGIGVAMMSQQWRYSLDQFPCNTRGTIYLPGNSITSVDSVNYLDPDGASQVVDSADYTVDLNRDDPLIEPAYGTDWPSTRDQVSAIWILYTLGAVEAQDVPQDLVQATAMLATHWYDNRDAISDVPGAAPLPFGVQSILDRNRRSYVAG